MRKGKILKLKLGYNPNSSSIGTEIVVFFTSVACVSAVFSAVAAVISSRRPKKYKATIHGKGTEVAREKKSSY